jgi:pimeloyl-ACP methyl ester carboxylesterase
MARVTLTNGGVDLVADVEGPARGPTTLLLHAGGETRSVWRPISNELVEAGWRTIAPDLRGHGESDWFAGGVAAGSARGSSRHSSRICRTVRRATSTQVISWRATGRAS